MEKTTSIIRTKLHSPYARIGLVPRPRLQEQIEQGLRGLLTLVTAPAGFGKTTLVASAVSRSGLPVGWLSVDTNDNQEWRFLSYLIAALQEADPSIGCEAAELLAAQRATPEIILTSLVNDLGALHHEMVLVLDDYQLINSQAVHQAVTFLLDHSPWTFHLVIATRSDPQLPLARLRGRGQLVELRTADLRFTRDEAAQFLNEVMNLQLDAGAVEVLEDRTEGWIAGLQMAAIAMRSPVAMETPSATAAQNAAPGLPFTLPSILEAQGSPSTRGRVDTSNFIEGFSGTHHYIMDYLLEEVLAVQPVEIQQFLLHTSVLERLSAPLCDAVLGNGEEKKQPDSPGAPIPRASAAILEYLERANLFLIPLDEERKWYRYHHLFADLLRARLQQNLNSEQIGALHTRAARWYEQNDLVYDAIHHASLIPDMEWVERVITENYQDMFRRMELAFIRFLTGSLSREMVYKKPWLCIYEAESAAWFGQLDEADRLLTAAEKHILPGDTSAETQALIGHLSYIRSRITAMRGDVRQAIAICITARKNTPASKPALQCGIGVLLGYLYFLDGDFPDAIQALNETIQLGTRTGVISTTVASYCVLARLHVIQGRLHTAFDIYQSARKYAQEEGSGHRGGMGIVDVGIAAVLYEWNDLETARTNITKAMEFILHWRKADDIVLAYTTLAAIQQAQGNRSAARESIQKAAQLIQTSGVFWEARQAAMAAETRLRLAPGDRPAASRFTGSPAPDLGMDEDVRFEDELPQITLARVALDQKNPEACLKILARLEGGAGAVAGANSGARIGRLIEILLLKALAYQSAGEPARALESLPAVLAMAEPEGYARVFLDEGEPMRALFVQWLAQAKPGPLRDYAARLLAQFSAGSPEPTALEGSLAKNMPGAQSGNALLVEPLTRRELEVLQLMALGKTNPEIARQLVVSPGTIKAHAARIYNKLDAANRTEAVARARLLKILP